MRRYSRDPRGMILKRGKFADKDQTAQDLISIAANENWTYLDAEHGLQYGALWHYLGVTFQTVLMQKKIETSFKGTFLTWNTGLRTKNDDQIFCVFQCAKRRGDFP